MGLDNNLILRSSRLEALQSILPRNLGYDPDNIYNSSFFGWRLDILYLRKCWNIRNVVMRECFAEEEKQYNDNLLHGNDEYVHYIFNREKLEKFHEILEWFIYHPDNWTDEGSSIWEFEVCRPHLLNAIKIVAYCLDHKLYEPNIETGYIGIEWIDSY